MGLEDTKPFAGAIFVSPAAPMPTYPLLSKGDEQGGVTLT
jgi:hypothetical protein